MLTVVVVGLVVYYTGTVPPLTTCLLLVRMDITTVSTVPPGMRQHRPRSEVRIPGRRSSTHITRNDHVDDVLINYDYEKRLCDHVLHSVQDEVTKEDDEMKKSHQYIHVTSVMMSESGETVVDDGWNETTSDDD